MKYNVVFWELDMKLAKSMSSFITKEIDSLSEAFPNVIYNKTIKDRPNSNRFVIRCVNGQRIDLIFSCIQVEDERKAMNNSEIVKKRNNYDKLLSVINLGSTYFHFYKKHDLTKEGIKPHEQDFKVDEVIINELENKGIEVLLTNCIHNFKYSKPEYMLDRVEVYDKVDSAWPAPDYNRHINSLVSHKSDIDPNLYNVIKYLLTSPIINTQMFGELIYKAVYPMYWKEYTEEKKEQLVCPSIVDVHICTDTERNNGINEINNLEISKDNIENLKSEEISISLDEFKEKAIDITSERPDVDSLIYESDDDNKRRR